jgi:c-di-GMP-binding flagellar brake protein YcgR
MSKAAAKPKARKKPARPAAQPPADPNRRREWRFDLPLPAVIEGRLPQGRSFKEEARLRDISATGAYFCLDSGVSVGTKLKLWIDLPKEATGGKKVRIQVGGLTIRLEKPDIKGKKQGVAVRFSKNFKFVGSK